MKLDNRYYDGKHYLAEPGDKVKALGITITIQRVVSQEHYPRLGNEDDWGWNIEFIGSDGQYRHWKQWEDGGKLIAGPKKYIDSYGVDCTDIFRKFGYC